MQCHKCPKICRNNLILNTLCPPKRPTFVLLELWHRPTWTDFGTGDVTEKVSNQKTFIFPPHLTSVSAVGPTWQNMETPKSYLFHVYYGQTVAHLGNCWALVWLFFLECRFCPCYKLLQWIRAESGYQGTLVAFLKPNFSPMVHKISHFTSTCSFCHC